MPTDRLFRSSILAVLLIGVGAFVPGVAAAQGVAASPSPAPRLSPPEIAARASAALVGIVAVNAAGEEFGQGSGFFVNDSGVIVTNLHVVDGAHKLRIKTSTGEIYDTAYLRHVEERRDIAVLHILATRTPYLRLGDDPARQIGDRVFAMGNPMGMDATFSDGMLSARRMLDGTQMLQITAPISPGSSGGPVLGEDGLVIGVATAQLTEGQNLNLVVPAHYVLPMLDLTTDTPFSAATLAAALGRPAGVPEGASPGVAVPAPATVSSPVQTVRLVLDQIIVAASDRGFTTFGEEVLGSLAQGEVESITVDMSLGRKYFFAGVCDLDCGDLDLMLQDSKGQEVSRDSSDDDHPLVAVDSAKSGTYVLLVSMARCSQAPCAYGVRGFQPR